MNAMEYSTKPYQTRIQMSDFAKIAEIAKRKCSVYTRHGASANMQMVYKVIAEIFEEAAKDEPNKHPSFTNVTSPQGGPEPECFSSEHPDNKIEYNEPKTREEQHGSADFQYNRTQNPFYSVKGNAPCLICGGWHFMTNGVCPASVTGSSSKT